MDAGYHCLRIPLVNLIVGVQHSAQNKYMQGREAGRPCGRMSSGFQVCSLIMVLALRALCS